MTTFVGWLGLPAGPALMVFWLFLLPLLLALAGAGVQRSYLIHSINYGSIRNVAFLPSLPPRDKRGWAGRILVGRDRGAGGRGTGRQGDERGEYFVHVKGAELKAGRTRGRARREGGTPKGGREGALMAMKHDIINGCRSPKLPPLIS